MVPTDDSWALTKIWKRKAPLRYITEKALDDSAGTAPMSSGHTLALPFLVPSMPGKDPNFGTNAVIKTFYEDENTHGSNYGWVDTPPKQLSKNVAKAHERFAIKIYKIKDPEQPKISGRSALKFHMVELQSPVLVGALKDIVKHECVFLEAAEPAQFMEPFKPLYFCYGYEKFVRWFHDASETSPDQWAHIIQACLDVLPKDSIVYSGARDCERVCKVIDTEYRSGHIAVICQEIGFDGDSFTWKKVEFELLAFKGNIPVTVLPYYPLSFHEDQEGVKMRLTARGKKVLDYQQLAYCEYSGLGIFKGQRTEQNHNRAQDLIFLSLILAGYSLKAKLWLNFYVDDIKPVVWNDEAYDHLVYPEEQKDLVSTFVWNHQRTEEGVDDVIMGKGQGLIILLSGPPGTSKTLTAEAVADKTRRPLYYLQAEDLGVNPSILGLKIKEVFEMATEWNAVVLLDEADVFMAQRSPADIARNELVSIFLRELEYFRGIIFLTTNLYATVDAAFRSRVNIHLVFTSLSVTSRLMLWRKFLSRLPPSLRGTNVLEHLLDGDLDELARWELDGREIKNAIKTVKTWCDFKGVLMSLVRLKSGIKVTAPQSKKFGEREQSL